MLMMTYFPVSGVRKDSNRENLAAAGTYVKLSWNDSYQALLERKQTISNTSDHPA